jgi:hypothetical protein
MAWVLTHSHLCPLLKAISPGGAVNARHGRLCVAKLAKSFHENGVSVDVESVRNHLSANATNQELAAVAEASQALTRRAFTELNAPAFA